MAFAISSTSFSRLTLMSFSNELWWTAVLHPLAELRNWSTWLHAYAEIAMKSSSDSSSHWLINTAKPRNKNETESWSNFNEAFTGRKTTQVTWNNNKVYTVSVHQRATFYSTILCQQSLALPTLANFPCHSGHLYLLLSSSHPGYWSHHHLIFHTLLQQNQNYCKHLNSQ